MTMTQPDGFFPTGPKQPAPGIIWPVEEWKSFGASEWDLSTRCVVCGGDLKAFDHARCVPSMEHAAPAAIGFDVLKRQLERAKNGNSAESADSVERLDMVAAGEVSPMLFVRDLPGDYVVCRRLVVGRILETARKHAGDAKTTADNFDMMTAKWGEAMRDVELLDLVGQFGVIVRPIDPGAGGGFVAEVGGKWTRATFGSWRDAARHGVTVARGQG